MSYEEYFLLIAILILILKIKKVNFLGYFLLLLASILHVHRFSENNIFFKNFFQFILQLGIFRLVMFQKISVVLCAEKMFSYFLLFLEECSSIIAHKKTVNNFIWESNLTFWRTWFFFLGFTIQVFFLFHPAHKKFVGNFVDNETQYV